MIKIQTSASYFYLGQSGFNPMASFNAVVAKICYVLPFALAMITGLPSNALAQPYTNNSLKISERPRVTKSGIKFATCAVMQDHFNSLQWNVDQTIFSGFEKREKENIDGWGDGYVTDERCFKGYRTEISPLGTLVCAGYIERRGDWNNRTANEYKFYFANQNRRDSCRYKN
jgi:hypothetical protein